MPYVKSLRPLRISTLSGHIVNVPALVPTFVPPAALAEAKAAGCVTCDEHGKIVLEEGLGGAPLFDEPDDIPFLPPEDRDDPAKRKRVVTLAVLKCFKRNNRDDFGNNGVPKANVVTRMIGFQVSGAEVADATEAIKSVDD